MINPYHDETRLLSPQQVESVLRLCGEILGESFNMIASTQEVLLEIGEMARVHDPQYHKYMLQHIHAIRVKAFGSEMYEPKNGLEVRTFYRETLRYCLELLNRNEAGMAVRRAERGAEKEDSMQGRD